MTPQASILTILRSLPINHVDDVTTIPAKGQLDNRCLKCRPEHHIRIHISIFGPSSLVPCRARNPLHVDPRGRRISERLRSTSLLPDGECISILHHASLALNLMSSSVLWGYILVKVCLGHSGRFSAIPRVPLPLSILLRLNFGMEDTGTYFQTIGSICHFWDANPIFI